MFKMLPFELYMLRIKCRVRLLELRVFYPVLLIRLYLLAYRVKYAAHRRNVGTTIEDEFVEPVKLVIDTHNDLMMPNDKYRLPEIIHGRGTLVGPLGNAGNNNS
jgi:hypothetical protein